MIQQYLALGDSYSIGEGVALFDSFPYQLVQNLRTKSIEVAAPEIVAKTGFTTSELLRQLETTCLLPYYQLVTVLIGVNDQYRGLPVTIFENGLKKILDLARGVTGKAANIYVLSIPDYSLSPFAISFDRQKISAEIGLFNTIIKAECAQRHIPFIDITDASQGVAAESIYASDGLHPSAAEYARWVGIMMQQIELNLLADG